ncbi:hypothetical protein [Nocardioides conyzicola]|uniref:Uncharacterized protein n=1 Tax=Nocardioides conyzicola TaxID=1651781 RepID=A0ABP8WPH7_9ACTN
MLPDRHTDELTIDDLGPGWEETKRALDAVQADLSRTVPGAPRLLLLWRNADPTRASNEADVPDGRWAYIGKARDWYFGANGGFALPREYANAVQAIASDVSDAVVDTLLGYYAYWPHCPDDDCALEVRLDAERRCWWSCRAGDHNVGEVGHLPTPAS